LSDAPPARLHLSFRFDEVRPPLADVAGALGYASAPCPDPVQAGIREILASEDDVWSIEGGCLLHPRATLAAAGDQLCVDQVAFDVGRVVAGQLSRSTGIAVFLCTAGYGIQKLSQRLMSAGDPFTAFVADTVGSLVVERAMDRVQDALAAALLPHGLRVTNRYSPGYCGWKVDEQQKLFRLLPPGFCGVSLSDSSLMQPTKSVSGVIGVGATVRRNPYTCNLCEMEHCLYRQRPAPSDVAGACGPAE
jgi:hypothetical protein